MRLAAAPGSTRPARPLDRRRRTLPFHPPPRRYLLQHRFVVQQRPGLPPALLPLLAQSRDYLSQRSAAAESRLRAQELARQGTGRFSWRGPADAAGAAAVAAAVGLTMPSAAPLRPVPVARSSSDAALAAAAEGASPQAHLPGPSESPARPGWDGTLPAAGRARGGGARATPSTSAGSWQGGAEERDSGDYAGERCRGRCRRPRCTGCSAARLPARPAPPRRRPCPGDRRPQLGPEHAATPPPPSRRHHGRGARRPQHAYPGPHPQPLPRAAALGAARALQHRAHAAPRPLRRHHGAPRGRRPPRHPPCAFAAASVHLPCVCVCPASASASALQGQRAGRRRRRRARPPPGAQQAPGPLPPPLPAAGGHAQRGAARPAGRRPGGRQQLHGGPQGRRRGRRRAGRQPRGPRGRRGGGPGRRGRRGGGWWW